MRDFVDEQQELGVLAPKTLGKEVSDPILDVLVKARARLSNPANWGKPIVGGRWEAGAGCALSVCYDTAGIASLGFKTTRELEGLIPARFNGSVPAFNDDPATTHADVLSLFDRAIAARISSRRGG